jgi:hypothetical protein
MAVTIGTTDIDSAFASLVASLSGMRLNLRTVQEIDPDTQSVKSAPAPINVDLLQGALDHITENPAEHDQRVWARRKSTGEIVGCLAYHVTRLVGRELSWPPKWLEELRGEAGLGECAHVVPEHGVEAQHMFEAARLALGLSCPQANVLFHPCTTLDEQWKLAAEYTNGAIVRKENV